MPGRTVIPWDKDDIDVLGFFKMDVLGLGMLTAIRKALDFIEPKGSAIDRLARIPPEDPRVYDALCRADTVGVFQIESRAQMAMLPRLMPRSYYDLVIEVALVRPGPIQGGMVHPYLRRRSGQEPIDYPHPSLVPILERTLGVPLFQEQVMQIAIVGAGYTGGEADELRRDMAAWRRDGKLERHRERLRKGFLAKGISEAFAERLYEQIEGFGEYGFPESHAASFALLVYASAWLKVHHPAAFAAALVNSQPMGFYSASTIFEDARRHGIRVLGPCVMESDWNCNLIDERTIRMGLRLVKGLGEESGRRIVAARTERPFESIEDLAARAAVDKKELAMLAEAGALEAIVRGRRNALWKVVAPRPPLAGKSGLGLFVGRDEGGELPDLLPLTRAEQLVLDFERTGTSPDHPMKLMRGALGRDVATSRQIATMKDGHRAKAAGMVICRQRPKTASGVVFMTLEDELGFVSLVLYPQIFEHLRHVATQSPLVVAEGRIQREGDVVHLVVQNMRRLALAASVPSMSRDFH
jgi:error-prone DNA polymerase